MLIIYTATLSVYACVVLEIILGGGGVESVEALHLEGAPSFAALLTSFRFIDCELSGKTDKKKQKKSLFKTHSCMILTITTLM